MKEQNLSIKKVEIISVSPDLASKFLAKNLVNRRVRPSVVQKYADEIKVGKWACTHQGIAFNGKGELIDGQHRLLAIASGEQAVSVMATTYNEDCSAIDCPFDINLKRTMGDVSGLDKTTSAIISFIITEIYGYSIRISIVSNIRDSLGDEKIEWIAKNIGNKKNIRVFSQAAVKTSVFLAYLNGYDWTEQYSYVCNMMVEKFEEKTSLYFRKMMDGGISSRRTVRKDASSLTWLVATGQYQERVSQKALDSAWDELSLFTKNHIGVISI